MGAGYHGNFPNTLGSHELLIDEQQILFFGLTSQGHILIHKNEKNEKSDDNNDNIVNNSIHNQDELITNYDQASIHQKRNDYNQVKDNDKEEINDETQILYKETPELREHIENPSLGRKWKDGIKGGHNKLKFMEIVKQLGLKVTNIKPHPTMKGIENIYYKMPIKDKTGATTSEYSKGIRFKTVYDPNIISLDQFIKRGIEAANNLL